jgi:hypothetical protein
MLIHNTAAGGLCMSGARMGAVSLLNEACAPKCKAQVRAYWGRN